MSKTNKQKAATRQDDAPAHGTLVDARRALRQATNRNDNGAHVVMWATGALLLLALLFVFLRP